MTRALVAFGLLRLSAHGRDGIGIGRNADALLRALWKTVPPQR